MSSLSFPGKPPNVLDNPGKVAPAMAGGVECLVNFLRVLAERGRSTRRLGGVLRQRQIFHHQRRGEAGLVIIIGGGRRRPPRGPAKWGSPAPLLRRGRRRSCQPPMRPTSTSFGSRTLRAP